MYILVQSFLGRACSSSVAWIAKGLKNPWICIQILVNIIYKHISGTFWQVICQMCKALCSCHVSFILTIFRLDKTRALGLLFCCNYNAKNIACSSKRIRVDLSCDLLHIGVAEENWLKILKISSFHSQIPAKLRNNANLLKVIQFKSLLTSKFSDCEKRKSLFLKDKQNIGKTCQNGSKVHQLERQIEF